MSRIGIDVSLVPGQRVGVGVYADNLVKELACIDSENKYVLFPFFTYIFSPNYKSYKPGLPTNFSLYGKNLPAEFWYSWWHEYWWLAKRMLPKFDVFHTTTFTVPPRSMYKRVVSTVYDVSFYTHPQFHLKANVAHCSDGVKWAVAEADKIVVISEYTKTDLVNYFDCNPSKIVVTPLAPEARFFDRAENNVVRRVLSNRKIVKPYLFHLGSLEPRKNTLGLVKAYRLLPETIRGKYDLVIGGAAGWMNSQIGEYIRRHNLDHCVKMIGYVDDDELPVLYQAATVFVYPSFYEGFGLPVMEAMASGCPVLTAANSSLLEIASGVSQMVNAGDVEDIANKLVELLESQDLQTRLSVAGRRRAEGYSWQETAKKTLAVYMGLSE